MVRNQRGYYHGVARSNTEKDKMQMGLASWSVVLRAKSVVYELFGMRRNDRMVIGEPTAEAAVPRAEKRRRSVAALALVALGAGVWCGRELRKRLRRREVLRPRAARATGGEEEAVG